jgi:hypothetical protein
MGLRIHFNVFPTLAQVNVTPLVFCTTPTFEHLPPWEAAEVEPLLRVVVKIRQIANAPMNLFR